MNRHTFEQVTKELPDYCENAIDDILIENTIRATIVTIARMMNKDDMVTSDAMKQYGDIIAKNFMD